MIGEKLLDQMVKKILPIRKALYLGYKFFFIFDNVISYLVYKKYVP